jgi:NADPH-dependent glutamate synthase beta subunit-like oxidoreductase
MGKYSGVVYATGAPEDSMLGIPGDDLIIPARNVVNWYNAYPDAEAPFDFAKIKKVAIIGNGNVALDIARILVAPPDILAPTDIAVKAIDQLRKHRVDEVHIIARRGSVQGAYSTKELRLTTRIPGIAVDMTNWTDGMTEASKEEAGKRVRKRQQDLIRQTAEAYDSNAGIRPVLRFRFLQSPKRFDGKTLTLEHTELSG